MIQYEMFHNEKNGTFDLHISIPDADVANYISRYADIRGDVMGDGFAEARSAVAFGAFTGLVDGDLHEELKYQCQEETDWADRLAALKAQHGPLCE